MADFMLLFKGGTSNKELEQYSPAEKEAQMGKWGAWIGGLAETGKFKGGDPLIESGKVLYSNSNGEIMTDGPFVEGKELVGGYLIVVADSEAGAVEIAKGCPILSYNGTVEVREIQHISMDGK